MPNQRAQISWNENGFWQGDLFCDGSEEPDAFFTMKKGQTADDAIAKARAVWPAAHAFIAEPDDEDDEC